jgi:hypothetical protein
MRSTPVILSLLARSLEAGLHFEMRRLTPRVAISNDNTVEIEGAVDFINKVRRAQTLR